MPWAARYCSQSNPYRILLVGVEVGRLHHPHIQLIARSGRYGHELLRREAIGGQPALQGGIVLQDTQGLVALRLVDRNLHGGIHVGETVDIVGKVVAKDRTIRTHLGR